jgi:hypothetical protein
MNLDPPGEAARRWNSNRPAAAAHVKEYADMGVTREEVRRWLTSRRVNVPTRGNLPRAAFEAFLRAHPERDTRK